jgi:hypothetical protein
LGCDGHTVNDTMPAYSQLLVVGFGFRTFPNYRTRVHLDAGGVNWDLLQN